jgi:hypothetical protein
VNGAIGKDRRAGLFDRCSAVKTVRNKPKNKFTLIPRNI